jgi:hypothetical protein
MGCRRYDAAAENTNAHWRTVSLSSSSFEKICRQLKNGFREQKEPCEPGVKRAGISQLVHLLRVQIAAMLIYPLCSH